MKTTKYLIFLFIPLLFTSCAYRYQVFDVDANNLTSSSDDLFFYEDERIGIYYDFWAEGGIMIFKVLNKTDRRMTVDFLYSTFSINGRTISYSEIFEPTSNLLRDNQQPPMTMRVAPSETLQVDGFPITWQWFNFNNQNQTKEYSTKNTPIRFYNKIVFKLEDQMHQQEVVNQFHIASIEKMGKDDFRLFDQMGKQKADKFYVYKEVETEQPGFWVDLGFELLTFFLF